MSAFEYDYLVFIGRFQPFHLGHRAVITAALQRASQVIVLIGSANLPRSTRNSFTVNERQDMILGAFSDCDASRIHCVGLDDALYNDNRWLQYVQAAVAKVVNGSSKRIGLIGHSKDASSYYLSLFPFWRAVSVPNFKEISATPIRQSYLLGASPLSQHVPESTARIMAEFKLTNSYRELQKEAQYIDDYKKQWRDSPFPPVFVTTDAVVVQAGHVLLVERKNYPGKGLYALPGGFLDTKETLLDGCIRELVEETCLDVPTDVLKNALHAQHTFDDPYRSARGRTITQAFYFKLKNDKSGLPPVQGSDDAASAFWLPLSRLDAKTLFEDHYAIIIKMVGL